MKYTVKVTDTIESEVDIDAMSEEEAVEIAREMMIEGELPYGERPWTHTVFTCGNATTDEWTQSLI